MPFRLFTLSILFILILAQPIFAADQPVALSRFISGKVELLSSSSQRWQPLSANQYIYAGDAVRTGPDSLAAILCADESQIKLHENTVMVFKEVAPSTRFGFGKAIRASADQRNSLYEVHKGKTWLRNSNESFRFQFETPALTAAIRGTEFITEVDSAGYSRISLLDGNLAIYNPLGELNLFAGEVAMARPGEPPTKQVLLNPEDAVQWALYYPGIISYRDLPLTSLSERTPSSQSALHAYNHGDMLEAGQLAHDALQLNPSDTSALTVLGFTQLRTQRPAEALEHFRRAIAPFPNADPDAMAGYALALYQLDDPIGAYTSYHLFLESIHPSTDQLGLAAFFALMAGKPEHALDLLEKATKTDTPSSISQALLSQIYLIRNQKSKAGQIAAELVAARPDSPLANLTAGLSAISRFELESAEDYFEKARHLDPLFIHAYVYLARLQLGAEDLDKAQSTILSALEHAPDNGYLHSINGFVQLGLRNFDASHQAFVRANATEPSMGEPYMGLAMIDYANGDDQGGLQNLLTATLLDPRISLYQSVLGKAFYRSRNFDKALTTYDYAAQLDPNDPTPHLYRGIALTNLNRPGEAIEAFNTSIAKNDNRAVFRSKLMLDRDLAVRNFDIAKPFAQLGLDEWSYSKALTSIKNDPRSSSAHLFLSSAFASDQQRFAAARTEFLLYRLLAPANQETFTLFNDYTPMFEAPYSRTQLSATAGEWRNGNSLIKGGIEMYGGKPGFAWLVSGAAENDEGLRNTNSDVETMSGTVMLKFEPTVKDQIFTGATIYDADSGDDFNLNDWSYINYENMEQTLENSFLELGYVHHFNPMSTFIIYGKYESHDYRINNFFFEPVVDVDGDIISAELTTRVGTEAQTQSIYAQQQLVTGDHTLMAGIDYYSGDYQDFQSLHLQPYRAGVPLPVILRSEESAPDMSSLRAYILDYWKPTRNTVFELGLSAHSVEAPRQGFADPIREDQLGGRLGLNWQISDKDVLRLALQHYLNGDVTFQTSLEPADVAGFPSWLNAHFGTTVTEAGIAWERQWNDKTFSVLRVNTHHLDNPQLEAIFTDINRYSTVLDRYQVRFDVNRILTPSLGLWAQLLYKRLAPDDETAQRMPNTDFTEYNGAVSLSYQDRRGLAGNLTGVAVYQDFHDSAAVDLAGNPRESESFMIATCSIGYELPDKLGNISLEVHNLFDTHFSYELEPVAIERIYPARRILVRLYLNF